MIARSQVRFFDPLNINNNFFLFTELFDFLGATVRPELKITRYRLNLRQQSPLNRMVLVRVNAKIVGRRVPLVARVIF